MRDLFLIFIMDLFGNKESQEPKEPMFVFKFECYNFTDVVAKQDVVKIKVKAESVEEGQRKAMSLVNRKKYEVIEAIEVKN